MKKINILLALALLSFSCASFGSDPQAEIAPMQAAPEVDKSKVLYAQNFESRMRMMSQSLAKKLRDRLPERTKVVITTFLPVGEYGKAEVFGQLCAEQMQIGLAEQNFQVYDLRKTNHIFVKDDAGFFALSNDFKVLRSKMRADLILVGSYTLVGGDLLLNAMLLGADDGQVVSSASQLLRIADDEFLGPLVSPLFEKKVKAGADRFARKNSIVIRESIDDRRDSPSKKLSLNIEKLSYRILEKFSEDENDMVVLVTTYVDLDNLNRTNSFGRYVSENLIEELTKRGIKVVEARISRELMVTPNIGSTVLSDEIEDIRRDYKANVVVLGTYRKTGDEVKVYTRMVIPESQEIISAGSIDMKIDPENKFIESLFEKDVARIGISQNVEGY
ncbi:MAG: FlgO family outer membrane protein [Nitrospinota bacterium]|nr:FlgO family outer membrane protein [Nitrospinota bacterium]